MLPVGTLRMAPEVQWCLGQSWSHYPAYVIVGLVWLLDDDVRGVWPSGELCLALRGSSGLSWELGFQ